MKKFEERMKYHILPTLGMYKFVDIDYELLIRWQNILLEKTYVDDKGNNKLYSIEALMSARKEVSKLLQWGIRRQYVHSNPITVVEPFQRHEYEEEKEQIPMTVQDFATLRTAFNLNDEQEKRDYCMICMIWYGGGIRPGELTGLWFENIDLEKRTVTIKKSIDTKSLDENGNYIINKTKNRNNRTNPIPDTIFSTLEEYIIEQKKIIDWHQKIYLFGFDNAIPYSSFNKLFHKYLERVKLNNKDYTPYSLRHGFATYMLSCGMSIKAIANMMGNHPNTLLKHYAHALKEDYKKAMDLLDNPIYNKNV